MDREQEFDKRIAELYGLDNPEDVPYMVSPKIENPRQEEFRAMAEAFLGEDYDHAKLNQVENLQKNLWEQQASLLQQLENAQLSPEVYVDTFNDLLRNTFSQCESILGEHDFLELFGAPVDELHGFIDKDTFAAAERADLVEESDRHQPLNAGTRELELRYDNAIVALRVIQSAVCFNQGAYLQYSFITAEKHRNLKDAYRKQKHNVKQLSLLANQLVNHINREFYTNTFENFKLLRAYFKSRPGPDPRICIKGSFKVDNKTTVVSVFRDNSVDYDSDTDIENNSGFYKIFKSGTYFLENDVPTAAAEGRYHNPRLDIGLVKEFIGSDKKKNIQTWRECWLKGSEDSSSCYKSTLIVPMTLWNNKVSTEFKKLINMENVQRTIFGFLCFDHEAQDYFHADNDVAVGYVFADILSLYIFTRLIYMEISKTFRNVHNWLESKDVELEPKSLASLWTRLPAEVDVEEILTFKPETSEYNDLFSIDRDLLRFVREQ